MFLSVTASCASATPQGCNLLRSPFRADVHFPIASLVKIPLAAVTLDRIRRGDLDGSPPVEVDLLQALWTPSKIDRGVAERVRELMHHNLFGTGWPDLESLDPSRQWLVAGDGEPVPGVDHHRSPGDGLVLLCREHGRDLGVNLIGDFLGFREPGDGLGERQHRAFLGGEQFGLPPSVEQEDPALVLPQREGVVSVFVDAEGTAVEL
jgi:hypothetical protein